MFVTLVGHTPCLLCGYRLRAFVFDTFRINKRTLRKSGKGLALTAVGRHCPECGTPNHHTPPLRAYRPTAEDTAKIRAYRLRRWPELAEESP